MQVTTYEPDTTPPSNVQFTVLDIDAGILQIRTQESLSINVNIQGITLQQYKSGRENYTLINREISYVDELDKREVRIIISDEDLQTIKLNRNLGSSGASSFLVLEAATLQDTAFNPIAAIHSATAIPVDTTGFVGDTTPPRLVQFDLDMNAGILVATFDDIVLSPLKLPEYLFLGVQMPMKMQHTSSILALPTVVTDLKYQSRFQLLT